MLHSNIFYKKNDWYYPLTSLWKQLTVSIKKWRHTIQMTNYRPVYIYHFSVKMYTGLSLVVSIVWRHFFIGTISCLVFVLHFLWTYLSLFSLLQKGIWFERIWIWPRRTCPSLWWHHWWVTISFSSALEAFYSAYKKMTSNWPTIGQLKCILYNVIYS